MSLLPERRHEVSRHEAFSDAVFAFALTPWASFSGLSYFLIGPAHGIFGAMMRRRRKAIA